MPQVVDQREQFVAALRTVGGGIDPDDGVAVAEEEPIDGACQHALRVIDRMVGLDAGGQAAGKTQRIAKPGDDLAFGGNDDEVLVARNLGDRRRHFRRETGRQGAEGLGRRLIGQQPVAKAADGEVADRRECRGVVAIDDQPRDFVVFVRDDHLAQKGLQRDIRERHLGGDTVRGTFRGDACQAIAGAQR